MSNFAASASTMHSSPNVPSTNPGARNAFIGGWLVFAACVVVRTFGHANIPQAGGEYYTVNVHCLEGADLSGVPVKYYDGAANNWWNDAPPFP